MELATNSAIGVFRFMGTFVSLRDGRAIDRDLVQLPNLETLRSGYGRRIMGTQRSKFGAVARRCAAVAVVFAFGMAGTAIAGESLTLTAGSPGGG